MKIARLFASGFGLGYLPKAPGTWGSLGIVLALKLFIPPSFTILSLLIMLWGILGYWGINQLKTSITDDPKWIVIDEFFGQSLTFLGFYPYYPHTWVEYILAFLLFRFLDIYKPFPISYFDQQPTVAGIMLDDGVAGIIAALVILNLSFFKF